MKIAVLDRKLIRDLSRIWAQSLAIAMVMACGVATIILSVGSYQSLLETRDAFYERYRFGTVFASAVRAPEHVRSAISRLQGVSSVEVRVNEFVLIDVPGMMEPVNGLAISIPDRGEPAVNRLYLREGRLPDANRKHEVSVLENFATAHRLGVGDSFEVTMNNRKRRLIITGIVLSPEFIYSIGPGEMVPDPRRFGVFFMPETTLRGIFDMDGAFNSLSLTTIGCQQVVNLIDNVRNPGLPHGR